MMAEPPDGLLKLIFSLTLILIVYLYPILRGLTRLRKRSLIAYMSQRRLPILHIRMYATAADSNEKAFSWDTYGTPFVVDNSETADGVSTKTQIIRICRLVLANNKNINYTYDVPG